MRELLGQDDIPGLLAAWYGPPDRPGVPGLTDDRLPAALRDWYVAVSRYGRPVLFGHAVHPPAGLTVEDGRLAFCVDDFEVQEFGVVPGPGNPVVHRRLVDGDGGWEPNDDGLRLSRFLLALLRHEAVQSTRYGAAADGLSWAQCERLLAPMHRLPGPDLFTAQYAGAGLLGIVWPAGETWRIRLAARDQSLLSHAAVVPSVVFGPGESWAELDQP